VSLEPGSVDPMPTIIVQEVTYFVEFAHGHKQLFHEFTSDSLLKVFSRFSMTTRKTPLTNGGPFCMMMSGQKELIL